MKSLSQQISQIMEHQKLQLQDPHPNQKQLQVPYMEPLLQQELNQSVQLMVLLKLNQSVLLMEHPKLNQLVIPLQPHMVHQTIKSTMTPNMTEIMNMIPLQVHKTPMELLNSHRQEVNMVPHSQLLM